MCKDPGRMVRNTSCPYLYTQIHPSFFKTLLYIRIIILKIIQKKVIQLEKSRANLVIACTVDYSLNNRLQINGHCKHAKKTIPFLTPFPPTSLKVRILFMLAHVLFIRTIYLYTLYLLSFYIVILFTNLKYCLRT